MTVTLETLKKKVGKKKKSSVSMVYAWLADLEREAGDIDGSLSCVNEGLQFYANDLPGVLVRSKIFFQKGEFEACIAECEKALQKDPFCLSAQMRMGKAYEQLGNLPERNKCFRRVHDMDPLDSFWKDEYDDGAVSAPVEDASAEGELDFSMPELADDSLNEGADGGFSLEKSVDANATSADPNAVIPADESVDAKSVGEGVAALFGKALDDALESEESSSADVLSKFLSEQSQEDAPQADSPFAEPSQGESFQAGQGSEDVSPFEKSSESETFGNSNSNGDLAIEQTSLASSFSGMSSEADVSPVQTTSFDELFGATTDDIDSPIESESGAVSSQTLEDDPFAALAELLPGEDDEDNSIMDSLQESLDAVMADLENSSEESSDEMPSEENISGGDVSSALFDMFGSDDNLEEAGSEGEASPFANLNIPESISEDTVTESKTASSTLDDDKPMSVDSAFSSIFGDDDLPEELPADDGLKAEESLDVSEGSSLEPVEDIKPVEEEPAAKKSSAAMEEDKPVSLDSAFASIFGDDELPEESSLSMPAEKSDIDAVFGISSDVLNDDSFKAPSSIFDDDEKVDIPTISATSIDDNFAPESAENELASIDDSAKSATVEFEESSEPAIPEKSEEARSAFDSELEKRMGGAFSNIFGDEDDSLQESTQTASAAETEKQEEEDSTETIEFVDEPVESPKPQEGIPEKSEEARSAFDSELEKRMGGSFSNDIDDVAGSATASNSSAEVVIPEKSEEARSAFDSELEKRMGGAFSNIFGDEDDSVEENPQASQAAETASVAEPVAAVDEAPVAEPEAAIDEAPVAEPEVAIGESASEASPETENSEGSFSADSELENQVGGAFKGIFGDDDDFTGTPEKTADEPVEKSLDDSTLSSEVASEGDSLESQLGGAFSNIFGDEDEFTGVSEKTAEESLEKSLEETALSSETVSEGDSLENQLGGAFSNIFGDDDEFTGAKEKSIEEPVEKSLDDSTLSSEVASEGDSLENQLGGAFKGIFGDDDSDIPESESASSSVSEDLPQETPVEESSSEEATGAAIEERVIPDDSSLDSEVSGAFKGLFYTEGDAPAAETEEQSASSGTGVDFLMSGDSDDDVSVGLIKDPSKPLDNDANDIDDSLNTKTLAEIYFEQGLFAKALEIYQDLCGKEPENSDYKNRMAEIEKIYHEKFGDA